MIVDRRQRRKNKRGKRLRIKMKNARPILKKIETVANGRALGPLEIKSKILFPKRLYKSCLFFLKNDNNDNNVDLTSLPVPYMSYA